MIQQLRTLTRSSVLLTISLQSWTVSLICLLWSSVDYCKRGQQKPMVSIKAVHCMIALSTVVSSFLDWFWKTGIRAYGWQGSFPQLLSVAQISVTSITPSFVTWRWLRLCCMEWGSLSNSHCFLCFQKCVFTENECLWFFCVGGFLCLYCCYFMSARNQIDIVCWKWVLMFAILKFVIVL